MNAQVAADSTSCQVERWQQGRKTAEIDQLAEEIPLSIRYNGQPFAVMMVTPRDLEDFALGFSLTEGVIESAEELGSVNISPDVDDPEGLRLCLEIPQHRADALPQATRILPGRSGCGICGMLDSGAWRKNLAALNDGLRVRVETVQAALSSLSQGQTLNAKTGSVHAAAWCDLQGKIRLVREDVGRHNALDKLIGVMAADGIDPLSGFVVVTSRASYEIVLKALRRSIPFLVAVSAPTGMAARMAVRYGLTLVGFARQGRHVVYANPQRLIV